MKTSDYDIVHFLEEHSFISRSDVDAAIKKHQRYSCGEK